MKMTGNPRVRSLILAAGLTIGLCFVSPVSAQSYILDINSKTLTPVGTPGQASTGAALYINDAGQVVGYSYTATGQPYAFITGPNGVGMTDLGTLGGDYTFASGINDAGQVVGHSVTAAGQAHAFITGPNGVGMTDLGTLGGDHSYATGINNTGQVWGGLGLPQVLSTLSLPAPMV